MTDKLRTYEVRIEHDTSEECFVLIEANDEKEALKKARRHDNLSDQDWHLTDYIGENTYEVLGEYDSTATVVKPTKPSKPQDPLLNETVNFLRSLNGFNTLDSSDHEWRVSILNRLLERQNG